MSRWYTFFLSLTLALIVLVAMGGVISLKTLVLGKKEPVSRVQEQQSAYYLVTLVEEKILYIPIERRMSHDILGAQRLLGELLSVSFSGEDPFFSLIPPEVELRNLWVEGEVLYVDFSEDLQFNPYGSEGYAGALHQILRTLATVSPVSSVQILIEGQTQDFLHEGVFIGEPILLQEYQEEWSSVLENR
ncbi:GerMN domain-containing protein [Entomospira culicis]|nr:GerMN domain-containing protein [Entomospira culicis]WDI37779.1 GerMN domain-containing protein [Entomospira culicis]